MKAWLRSLYEAQNEDIIPHYFTAKTSRRKVDIRSDDICLLDYHSVFTPYDCYALSYCWAHSSDQFSLGIGISDDDDTVSLLETLVKGLEDHCTSTTPSVEYLRVEIYTAFEEISNKTMFWLMKAKFMPAVEKLHFELYDGVVNSDLTLALLQSLVKLQSLEIRIGHIIYIISGVAFWTKVPQ